MKYFLLFWVLIVQIYVAGNNVNILQKMHIRNITLTHHPYDRIIESTNTVEGSKVFTNQTEYDRFGRVFKETYPGGYFITNRYDKYGYLTEITDKNNTNIWNALSSNAKGQLTSTSQGNCITSFGFDTRGFPTSINGSVPGMGYTFGVDYSFTTQGNLDRRTDYTSLSTERFSYDSMNRLTGWMTGSASYHPVTGLISTKSDLGSSVLNYGENGQPPHALTSISGTPSLIPSAEQSITYTDFKKVSRIIEDDHILDIMYGVGDQRIKTELANLSNPSGTLTRYYVGNYEEEIRNGNTRKIHYINGGNGLAALYVQNNGNDTLYYAHTDYQGSLLALSLENGTVIERYAYDPWGKRRNPMIWGQADTRTSFIIHRGYTMHEHLPEFNLINMNGRVYDPLVAQFLSTDPYVQAPGSWLNYNRYAYCLNNPLIYTDENGEWIHTAIGALVGGIANLAMNWKNIDGFWQGVAAFGVGAAAGAATASSFGASSGVWVGLAASAAGGAVVSGTNSVIEQTGHNFSGMNDVNWKQVGVNSAVGGVTGLASGAAGYGASNMSFLVNGINSPILRSAVVSPLAAGAGHIAGGTTANMLFYGQNFGEAFTNSFDGIGKSMVIGGSIGIAATIGTSYANKVSPWTGKNLTPKYNELYSNQIELKSVGAKGGSINKIDNNYLKQQGVDAHAIKREYLGKNAQNTSRFNLYKTPSGQIIVSDGKVQIPTDYFIK